MDPHLTTLISTAADFLFSTFDITEEQARQHAKGMVGLVDAKGGDVAAVSTAYLRELLLKQCGPELPWRDPKQKALWERNRRDQYDALKQAMGIGRDSPFGRKY